jgi:hypothetical protein
MSSFALSERRSKQQKPLPKGHKDAATTHQPHVRNPPNHKQGQGAAFDDGHGADLGLCLEFELACKTAKKEGKSQVARREEVETRT